MGLYGSAPKTPDPKETASAQTATNIGTAIANGYLGNVNQVTPDGNLTYSQTGTNKWTDPLNGKTYDLPTWTATTTLSQAQQAIKGQEDAASLNLATLANTQSNRLNTLLANPFTMNGAPKAGDVSKLTAPTYQQFGSGPNLQTSIANAGDITKSYDVDFDTSKYEDALMQRLNPSLQQNRAALEQQLANQGLQPGSDAYNRAIDTATRQENDARYGAILNAGQEQTRLANLANQQATFQNAAQAQQYGQNSNNASFGNSANQQMYQNQTNATAANNALKDQSFNSQQAIINAQNAARSNYLNENYAQRNQNINEVLGLASGAQVSNPNFVATQGQSIPTVDYASLVQQNYANQLGAYQQNQAGIGSLLGGIGSLFSLSDEDAKKNIKKVGGLYEYNYKDDPKGTPKRIGVMAQEIERIRPDAVRTGNDGYKRVNYGGLFAAGAK